MSSSIESLKAAFSKRNISFGNKVKVLKEYLRICKKYDKDEGSFVDEIEAKLAIHPDSGNPNLVLNKRFISSLEREFKKVRKKQLGKKKKKRSAKARSSLPKEKKNSTPSVKRPIPPPKRNETFIKPEPAYSPRKDSRKVDSTPLRTLKFVPTPLSKRKKLASKEEVVLSYSCKREEIFFNPNEEYPSVKLLSGVSSSEKYMTDSMVTKSEILSEKFCIWAEETLSSLSEDEQQNVHPINALPNTEGIFWGRVICESQDGFSPLNRESILLEGFKDSSNDYQNFGDSSESSRIAKLDLSELTKPSVLFPGQAVCVRGRLVPHPLGTLKVKEVIPSEVRYCPSENEERKNNEESVHIMVANGPFTTKDNLEFYPLMTVLEVAQSREVDLLILMGPFLSKDNDLIAGDKTLESYEDIMRNKVIGLIQHQPGLKNRTSIILIPSLKDVHGEFVFPQPPYYSSQDLEELQMFHKSTVKREDGDVIMGSSSKDGSKKQFLHSFSNPCVFSVKNVRIGVTSEDIFNQVKKVSYPTVVFPDQQTECYHILKEISRQNIFFPTHFLDPKIPFDYEMANRFFLGTDEEEERRIRKGGEEKLRPDLLIIPGSSDVFVVEVNGLLAINPGRIIKGKDTEGTYAHIVIEKDFLKKKMMATDEEKEGNNPIKVLCVEI